MSACGDASVVDALHERGPVVTQAMDPLSSIFTDGNPYADEEAWHGVATRLTVAQSPK